MSTFKVKVKWNKEVYDVELDTCESPALFKAQLYDLTNVPIDRQKVMFKGGVIKDDEWNPATLKGIKDGVTFLMIGSSDDLPTAPKNEIKFAEDMSETELASALELPGGMYNLGNTCYLNATMQCLYTVPELREILKKLPGTLNLNETFDAAQDVALAIRDVYEKMDQNHAVLPLMLLEMLHIMFPQFAEKNDQGQFSQQDANECWSELLKVLQQKLLIDVNGTKKSFIEQYFGGRFSSTMKCIENDEVSTSSEDFLQLSCFISQDVKYLQTGLKLRLEEEIDKFSTTLNRDAHFIKTNRISRLPAYLSVNLIRFFYKEKNSINAKILKDVKFSLTLDLYELCTPELQAKLVPMRQKFKEVEDKKAEAAALAKLEKKPGDKDEEETAEKDYYDYWFEDDVGSNNSGLYQLNAVLTHKGRSSSSGHYVGWIRRKGKWYKCDDENVTEVTEQEILKLSGGGDWHCAYTLLYGPQLIEKL